jgi:hypothetical protein
MRGAIMRQIRQRLPTKEINNTVIALGYSNLVVHRNYASNTLE